MHLEYFSERVSVHCILSDVQFLLSDVPQDSVLDPLISTKYICLFVIIKWPYNIKYNLYAVNT